MAQEKVQQLLVLAVQSIKAGDKAKGRQAFLAVIKLDPNNETAWMGLVSVAKDNRERLMALKQVLTRNPDNERALAVLDKLGITRERLLGITPTPPSDPEPEPEPYDEPESDSAPLQPLGSADYTNQDAPSNRISAFTDPLTSRQIDPDPEPEPVTPPADDIQRSVFESPPPMIGTEPGTPAANPQAISRVQADVENLVTDYLASEYSFDNIKWVHKTKRRAGERDIWKWRGQVLGAVVGFLLVFVGLPTAIFLSTPEGQKVVFAPTWTLSPTPTFTPTNTPGITPTPSSVPETTYTPTPTFQIRGVEDDLDLNQTPVATDVYSPGSIVVSRAILDAWEMIRNEEYVSAFEILEEEKLANDPGYPYPYYLQSQIDLLANQNPEAARGKLEAGEAQLVNIPSDDAEGFIPMYNLGHGEVLLYEALQAQRRSQTSSQLFSEAESRLLTAIDLDGTMIDAYIQLSRLYVAQEEYDAGIAILNRAIEIEGEDAEQFFTNISLRVERGQVYFQQGDYARAFQEANEAIFYDKYAEEAYILQAESALRLDRPGLANSVLDQYQLVFPDSVLAYKLEGDAYLLEGKADQALRAYAIALQGNEDSLDALEVIEARADLFLDQRRYDLALEAYTEYLDRRDTDRIRVKRMLSAYNAGEYDIALRDVRNLDGSDEVSAGDLELLRGQILVDTAQSANDYQDGLSALSDAVVRLGVSDESRAVADEYLARANFELGNFDQALLDINRALAPPFGADTGTRRFLKGQILQALEDYVAARNEYEFVIAWGEIYPYPFLEDAQENYEEVLDLIANPPEEDGA